MKRYVRFGHEDSALLAANRRRLLADESAENLRARRVEAGTVRVVRCGELRAGDELLLAQGDLVPVEAELLDEGTTLSLEWIRGESAPVEFARGAALPAGAFHLGAQGPGLAAKELL